MRSACHIVYIIAIQCFLGVVMSELSDEQTGILKALKNMSEPAGCKVIGEASDIPWRTVMAKLRGLKKAGYVDSPVKSKYVITDEGKKALT